jgi:hypothetical protein
MNPQAVEIMREALEKISSIHQPTSDPVEKYDPEEVLEKLDFAVITARNAVVWVVETSSGNEVVDSAGFVAKLISHVGDCLGALALPLFLAPSQTRTGPGKFGPPAPDRGAQPVGAQAQTAGQRSVVLGGLKRMVAKLACRVDPLPTRDRHREAA